MENPKNEAIDMPIRRTDKVDQVFHPNDPNSGIEKKTTLQKNNLQQWISPLGKQTR
jgi:hypothetical protein